MGMFKARMLSVDGCRLTADCRLLLAVLVVLLAGCSGEPADLTIRVETLVRRGDPEGALALVDQHLKNAPQDKPARFLRVKLLIHVRAVDEALQEYQRLWRIQGDPHPEVLGEILTAYLEEEVEAGGSSRLRAAPLVAHPGSPAALPLLYELASKGDPAARRLAVDALSRIGSKPAISFLTSLLKDPDPYIRVQAARGLGRLGAYVAKPELNRLLNGESEVVRVGAADGLARLGDPRATPVLLQALRSPRASIRMQAAEVLGALAVQEAAPELLATLNDSDSYVRLYAAQALVRLGETEGLTVLRGALEHSSSLSLRLYAAEVLANFGDETPRFLLYRVVADPTIEIWDRLYAAWILGRLDDPSGIRHIGGLLQDSDPYVRLRTAWTLGEIGDLGASPVLRSALLDPERAVRIHAAWALKRLLRQHPRLQG